MSAEHAATGLGSIMYIALSKAGRAPADPGQLNGEWEHAAYRSSDRSQLVSIARGVQPACQADVTAAARAQHGFYRGLAGIDSPTAGEPESAPWALFVGIDIAGLGRGIQRLVRHGASPPLDGSTGSRPVPALRPYRGLCGVPRARQVRNRV